jgi:hypothetical protein
MCLRKFVDGYIKFATPRKTTNTAADPSNHGFSILTLSKIHNTLRVKHEIAAAKATNHTSRPNSPSPARAALLLSESLLMSFINTTVLPPLLYTRVSKYASTVFLDKEK